MSCFRCCLTCCLAAAAFSYVGAQTTRVGIIGIDDKAISSLLTELDDVESIEVVGLPRSILGRKDGPHHRIPSATVAQSHAADNSAIILVPDTDRKGKFQGMTMVHRDSGGLLGDVSLSDQQTAASIAMKTIRRAVDKLSDQNLITLRLRSGDAWVEDQPVLAAFTEMLGRRISASDKIVVVLQSGDTTDTEDSDNNADVMLTLNLVQTDDAYRVTGEFVSEQFSENGIVKEVATLNGKLIDKLAKEICDRFDATIDAGEHSDVNTVASRFRTVADRLWAEDHFVAAVEAFELSLIVAATDELQRHTNERLAELVEKSRYRRTAPMTDERFVQLGTRAIALQKDIANGMSSEDVPALVKHFKPWGYATQASRLTYSASVLRRFLSPEQQARMDTNLHRALVRPIKVAKEATGVHRDARETYSSCVSGMQHYLRRLDPGCPARTTIAITEEWFDWFEQQPKNAQNPLLLNVVLSDVTLYGHAADAELIAPFHKRLLEHEDPYVQMVGMRGAMVYQWLSDGSDAEEQTQQFAKVRDAAIKLIDQSTEDNLPGRKKAVVDFLDRSYNSLQLRRPPMKRQMIETAEALMSRRIFADRIALDGANSAKTKEGAVVAHRFLNRLIKTYSDKSTIGQKATKLLRKLEHDWPDLMTEPRESPVVVKQIFDSRSMGRRPLILHPMIHGQEIVCVVLAEGGVNTWAQCVAIPLDGGTVRYLGEYAFPVSYGSIYQGKNFFVTAACLTDDAFVVAMGNGREKANPEIVEFSLKKSTANVRIPRGVLPSEQVQSLAIVGSDLYCGISGGTLIRFSRFATEKEDYSEFETIVSTSREQVVTPLDDAPDFSIPLLLKDQARKRLLMIVQHSRERATKTEAWALNPDSLGLMKTMDLAQSGRNVKGVIAGDLMTLTGNGISRWNLKNDNKMLAMRQSDFYTAIICAGSVWGIRSDGSLGKMNLSTRATDFHYMNELQGKPHDSSDGSFLVPVDDKRFVIYFAQQLWLATPKTDTP